MRKFLLPLTVIFLSPLANAEFCDWGYAGAKHYVCKGEAYVYGSAACPSRYYEKIFCPEKLSGDAQRCADDNSKQTVECYNLMRQHKLGRGGHLSDVDDQCTWGESGPQRYLCGGERFCYGTAVCSSGFYQDSFCREDLCGSGKKCANDNAPITLRCYELVTGHRPPSAHGASGGGWPSASEGVQ